MMIRFQELGPGVGDTIPTQRFTRNHGTWAPLYRTGGTYFKNCMMEPPRYSIWELHFGKFTDSSDFHCWRVNCWTEVCANTPFHQPTMSCIKEVEMATSMDDHLTSQSIEGEHFLILKCLIRR